MCADKGNVIDSEIYEFVNILNITELYTPKNVIERKVILELLICQDCIISYWNAWYKSFSPILKLKKPEKIKRSK